MNDYCKDVCHGISQFVGFCGFPWRVVEALCYVGSSTALSHAIVHEKKRCPMIHQTPGHGSALLKSYFKHISVYLFNNIFVVVFVTIMAEMGSQYIPVHETHTHTRHVCGCFNCVGICHFFWDKDTKIQRKHIELT